MIDLPTLITKLRQRRCLHWFDAPYTTTYDISYGAIICCEQKQMEVTNEHRICSKCQYHDTRRVSSVDKGWS
jgi:hypothetical protein